MNPVRTFLKCCLFLLSLSCAVHANNLIVTNVSLVNVSGDTAEIQFDISWSNSWRYTEVTTERYITNHDAAWVFIKFRVGVEWQHAWLAASGHSPSAGAKIDVASNGGYTNIGAFIYRSEDGNGNFIGNHMRLRWDFSKHGLTKTNNVDISVHAIEMVYIPERKFYVGSGGSESYPFYKYPKGTEPYYIKNYGAINVGAITGDLYYVGSGDKAGPIPAAFPNGFSPFYCMKYEITQGQYAQFLNFLPGGYDFQHYPDAFGLSRHTIHLTNGNYVADAPDRACNYLAWSDVYAYLDWSGLRPMTELEFEKACRGHLTPIPNEYAWGDTISVRATSFDGVDGSGTETVHEVTANCNYNNGIPGPIRVGIFAKPGTIRHQSGAGYYGVMELSGNIQEQVVTVGNAEGRAFTGNNGDGSVLTAPPSWPASATATGSGSRGGHWAENNIVYLRTSNRIYAMGTNPTRNPYTGGRGVRSAQ